MVERLSPGAFLMLGALSQSRMSHGKPCSAGDLTMNMRISCQCLLRLRTSLCNVELDKYNFSAPEGLLSKNIPVFPSQLQRPFSLYLFPGGEFFGLVVSI